MSDVVDDEDDYIEEDEEQKPASKSAFDSDHTVTPLASTTALPHRRLPSRSPVAV